MIEHINLNKASVTAELHGYMYSALYGYHGVLKYGSELSVDIVSNNQLTLNDGLLVNSGRFMKINGNETIVIENGTSGATRIDLIVAHFETDGINETHDIRVIKGEVNGDAPTPTIEDIYNGGLVAEMPLYEVHINGLNIEKIVKRFEVLPSFYELRSSFVNENLLINGDFRINQRGQTKYTGQATKGYTVDRWCMGDNDFSRTVEVVNGGVKLTNPNTTYNGTFQQILENSLPLGAYTVTVNVTELNGDGGIFYCGGSASATKKNLKLGINTLTIKDATVESATIQINPSSDVTIKWCKLEQGTVATPFVPRLYAEEFALCQRFYKEVLVTGLPVNYYTSDFAYVEASILLEHKMRASCNAYFKKADITIGFRGINDTVPSGSVDKTNIITTNQRIILKGTCTKMPISVWTKDSDILCLDAEIY